jgi:glutathionylspermidine synthase
MKREICPPRPDWQRLVEEDGLVWHSAGGETYWLEGAYYSFRADEIAAIETATSELYDLFIRVGDALVSHQGDWLDRFGIPQYVQEAIRRSWHDEPPALNFGRFDFGFGHDGVPRLFEFNCDTPTSLLEASVIQWWWKEALFPQADQFNSLHEKLVAKWKDLRTHLDLEYPVHFAHAVEHSGEDAVTVAYLRDTAEAAGWHTRPLIMDEIGVDRQGRFVDQEDYLIRQIFKLYPWEWMTDERFGATIVEQLGNTHWIEPIWKMLWSNKAILALLYTFEPECPYLLPASLGAPTGASYVKKPLLSREGANVTVVRDGETIAATGGEYGASGFVYQDYFDLPVFADGVRPVIGSWVVDGEPAGMGIREDGLVTGDVARFVPHIIDR